MKYCVVSKTSVCHPRSLLCSSLSDQTYTFVRRARPSWRPERAGIIAATETLNAQHKILKCTGISGPALLRCRGVSSEGALGAWSVVDQFQVENEGQALAARLDSQSPLCNHLRPVISAAVKLLASVLLFQASGASHVTKCGR